MERAKAILSPPLLPFNIGIGLRKKKAPEDELIPVAAVRETGLEPA